MLPICNMKSNGEPAQNRKIAKKETKPNKKIKAKNTSFEKKLEDKEAEEANNQKMSEIATAIKEPSSEKGQNENENMSLVPKVSLVFQPEKKINDSPHHHPILSGENQFTLRWCHVFLCI